MLTYITEPISSEALAYARKNLTLLTWDDPVLQDPDQAKAALQKVEAVLVRNIPMDAAAIASMPNLKIIAEHGVGVDNIDFAAAGQRNILVTNTPRANMNSVAELAIGLILDCARKITMAHLSVLAGVKRRAPLEQTGCEISGKVLGLVGLGKIGTTVGKRLKAGFEMEVLVYNRSDVSQRCRELGFTQVKDLKELCRRADVLSVSVALTEDTRNLIGAPELAVMKPGAILVNTSRGGIVDEAALYQALQAKKIYGAALDVFEQEPPAKDHPLLTCSNLVATPHNGANTREALYRMGAGCVDEILRFEKGEAPLAPVHK